LIVIWCTVLSNDPGDRLLRAVWSSYLLPK